MAVSSQTLSRLAARQHEQTPQALARLTVISLFIALWCLLWMARIPMPTPFLIVLIAEAAFFLVYWRAVFLLRSERHVSSAHYFMLGAEIVFHTTMVYFLGGLAWLGAFAYVFGLIFTNTYLDLRRGFVYTAGAAGAFVGLALLDGTGAVPHQMYLQQDALRYSDGRFLITTILGGTGVFFSIYLWVNWVGHQLREERDAALRTQDALYAARVELQRTNRELEDRVGVRTQQLEQANAALRESDDLLRATIESTADGILVVDSEGRVAYSNRRFAEMWRIPVELLGRGDDRELLEHELEQLADPQVFLAKVEELYGTTREDFDTLLFKDGRAFERFSRPLIRDRAAAGRVWSFRDVTASKQAEDMLRRQARHDALTGLLNHAAITQELHELASTGAGRLAVIMVDIDGMKAVNDTYGHQAGDDALKAVGSALQARGATVGRYGGDEFIAVLRDAGRRVAERYCQLVLEDLAAYRVRDPDTGSSIPVGASMGLAIYPAEAATIEDAIRLADNGMYAEKRERNATSGPQIGRGTAGDERAARMIGEIVPLLTSPGNLDDKLQLVANRLSIGAGYDVVRFDLSPRERVRGSNTYARVPDELVAAWDNERASTPDRPWRKLLRETRRPIIVDDLLKEGQFTERQRQIIETAGVKAALMVPMIWEDEMVGVLSVATKREASLDARDAQFLTTVADQVTAIIRMESLVSDLQSATSHLEEARAGTVILLAAAAEAHEHATGQHLARVQRFSEMLARELGHDEESAHAIGLAAVLHDIGKIRVPESILLSSSRLDGAEWALMKQHTLWGAEFLAARPGFELAAQVAAGHHERWDGAGYPNGLAGEAIPVAATIVSVADSLDAITNDRPYRASRTLEWALREIVRCSGTQFSPRVVEALQRLYERGALELDHADAKQRKAA